MFAVIFEVVPKPERWDDYLDVARSLKPEIEQIDGFIDNERFTSRRDKGRVLSLSIWRDEKAVIRWRTLAVHHMAQEKGRSEIFQDYHLRVGEVTADSKLPAGQALPQQRLDETEAGDARCVTISELEAGRQAAMTDLSAALGLPSVGARGLRDQEIYESIYTEGKLLLLVSWIDADAASSWTPRKPGGAALRHRQVRIVRDYGMFDRREAPQYYPAAPRSR